MFNKMLRRILPAVALALSLAAPAQAADTIRIGTFLPVTGPASFLGDPELKTLKLYIEDINENGGVLGKQLELIHYDDAGSAGEARTFAKRLVSADKVDIIIGGGTTGTTMAALSVIERAGVPFISFAGAVKPIEPVRKWVFKTPETDRMAARKVLRDMQAKGITKIGLLSGTGGFGRSGREQTLKVASEYGVEIVADETYGPKDTDMTAQLTKMRNAEGIEAIFVFGFGQAPAIVTKNYRALGIDLPFYQSHGVASTQFLDLAGDAAEGMLLPGSSLLVAEKLPDDDPRKAKLLSYINDYRAAYGSKPSPFGGYAYDGLMLAVDAYKRAGTTDKAAVRDAIENTDRFVGVTGIFDMSPEDHLGLDVATSFRMLTVRDGEFELAQ
ncbi:ABC transporter substrate-binding protein [Ectothiorhodospiraceae bacterium WFHF3C12]|nr:ABC transporter substrate-binding protein [Ectothiorhodospiraceae bacterium WFHF3C12]